MLRALASSAQPKQAIGRLLRMNSTGAKARGTLADKVALVTASTEGIGLAIARRLAQDGAHVVVSSRKQANVDRAVAELQTENLSVSGLVCHVGKAEDRQHLINAALERHGGIDILVSNAAVNPFFGSTLDATEEVWDKIFDINVKAAALLIKLVVPHMEKRGGGSIVIVSSIAAYSPFPDGRADGLLWHSLLPLFLGRRLHHRGDRGGGWGGPIPSLMGWGGPACLPTQPCERPDGWFRIAHYAPQE
ncbi:dehydrogenase/reductase SDR family member 4-like 2 isoform X2 [Podarcis raffonei]|uniref:dehydrogenase/reductase SDR family member 4-like 2 isoform X2 n=1 Tax=Podarcis raffonei TaxID=65483 RepID=UPI0023298FDB|nr:dehydrogenase/reductase SDR family member 4-like 2 isoform X2 [Podarcis raffonei]